MKVIFQEYSEKEEQLLLFMSMKGVNAPDKKVEKGSMAEEWKRMCPDVKYIEFPVAAFVMALAISEGSINVDKQNEEFLDIVGSIMGKWVDIECSEFTMPKSIFGGFLCRPNENGVMVARIGLTSDYGEFLLKVIQDKSNYEFNLEMEKECDGGEGEE